MPWVITSVRCGFTKPLPPTKMLCSNAAPLKIQIEMSKHTYGEGLAKVPSVPACVWVEVAEPVQNAHRLFSIRLMFGLAAFYTSHAIVNAKGGTYINIQNLQRIIGMTTYGIFVQHAQTASEIQHLPGRGVAPI